MAKRTAQPPQAGDRPAKRANRGQLQSTDSGVEHELLAQYYSEVRTLREYALAKLPASSRIRRRKIASVGLPSAEKTSEKTSEKTAADEALALGQFLDTTLVACRGKTAPDTEARRTPDLRWQQWIGFSQRADESYVTLSDGLRGSIYSQSEIVDFVVWLLFSREKGAAWPKNLLCDGFRKHVGPNVPSGPAAECAIPGVFSVYPNRRFQALKEAPWPQLLLLLGKEGERIMIDLLIDCAIFEAVKAGKGNLCQLSGKHISDLESLTAEAEKQAKPKPAPASERSVELRPSEITFVRNRMLYARAALNARGLVHFGLRHIHVLNRFPHRAPEPEGDAQPSSKPEPKSSKVDDGVIHIMMYIFPRQFGLHNVSLSLVDRQQTAQRFQDYTLREEEIAKKFPKKDSDGRPLAKHIPKRLRGTLPHLVERLQVLHGRCAYSEMIQHYCPVAEQIENERKAQPSQSKPARDTKKKPRQSTAPTPEMQYDSLIELATPVSSVSAFCQAVLSKIIPNDFWGKGLVQEHNKEIFLKNQLLRHRVQRPQVPSLLFPPRRLALRCRTGHGLYQGQDVRGSPAGRCPPHPAVAAPWLGPDQTPPQKGHGPAYHEPTAADDDKGE
ncbi:hypothetical protein B0H67DRAFT_84786 [Lasiosphaeris hirsuta]|uniref:Telomerase reverse transcriptase n=1 Tax=Lasiosphaeris hirsuta TaxID=260670 RepID=A0AA40EDW0_9PEZI|nr:hypothetical protein B0H67DRAFT_84786 [Lasiosphaeris hirsuta]